MMINSYSIPLSLYIHIPWCVQKCPYCDFNSHPARGTLPETHYIENLLSELVNKLPLVKQREIQTIFIGGGTPSLLTGERYQRLFSQLRNLLPLAPDAEITLEANPGTVETQHFNAYRELGINRLSLGVQSFQADKLKKLGRIHDGDEALKAIAIANAAGFDNFNLDLMFGLPGQTIADALADLDQALATNPTHLSWYQLTLEPNTLFYKHPPQLPNEDTLWLMQEQGQQRIATQFQHYEISAYSKSHFQCRHNLNYWRFGDYLGLGAGAHSKLTTPDGEITRHANLKHPRLYMNAENKIASNHVIAKKDLPFEFMLNACRLQEPVAFDLFQSRTGLVRDTIEQPLLNATQQGLVQVQHNALTLTTKGHRYLNNLLELFIPADKY